MPEWRVKLSSGHVFTFDGTQAQLDHHKHCQTAKCSWIAHTEQHADEEKTEGIAGAIVEIIIDVP